jgi:hypothetical protein
MASTVETVYLDDDDGEPDLLLALLQRNEEEDRILAAAAAAIGAGAELRGRARIQVIDNPGATTT